MKIAEVSTNPSVDIALDTINIGKQALVFVNTKRSAESTAEKISMKLKTDNLELKELSETILKALSSPTKQCRRLSKCVSKGVAFHHAGLAYSQRKIIEDNFKKGLIKIISCTPSLAMGVNLPAFRAIMRDLKRYGGRWGMQWIPVLEYHQMVGRAGRPDFNDDYGEAICIASSESEKTEVLEKYLRGEPEDVYSKLAVEPVLRSNILGLISTKFARSKKELLDFFKETLYGYQYGDFTEIEIIITKILGDLDEWGFIKTDKDDFVSADEIGEINLRSTPLGDRVSQLYLDPYTANFIITSLRRALQKKTTEFSYLQMVSNTLELRPLFKVKMKEIEFVEAVLNDNAFNLIVLEPSVYDHEYDDFLNSIKTAIIFEDWMDENNEEYLLEKYDVTPGLFGMKLNLADWILYSTEELAKMLNFNEILKDISKTRFRLKKGIKEELIPLVRLKKIGRVRARKLFRNGVKDIGDVKKVDITKLTQLLGKALAYDLKKQIGEEIKEVPNGRRKGQLGLGKF
ncbi:hypothetical protein HOD20_03895 [archaeon]|jgi:helicase|nr:hypothetical protein [archaeon]MBT4647946.1 hypothetical protein [archaeon]MBT6820822.1 hypothetical protein [archaeon]MBT7393180.1 hypothetical protein [archaeon]